MKHKQILKLQKLHGFDTIQDYINTGLAWRLEGSVGREASALLDSGACMLPKTFNTDAYGNRVPSRDVLKKGSKGTYQNSVTFWKGVEDGSIEIYSDNFEDLEN